MMSSICGVLNVEAIVYFAGQSSLEDRLDLQKIIAGEGAAHPPRPAVVVKLLLLVQTRQPDP